MSTTFGQAAERIETQQTILLVDDEPFIIRAVTRVLSAAGFPVCQCEQWPQLPSMVRMHSPALVLLDYNMPTLKGEDLCPILKRNAIGAMKVVLFSSEEESFLARAAARCGADGFIRKNTPPDMLVKRVQRMLL